MLDFYRQRGRPIFPTTSMANRWTYGVRHLFSPKYSQEVLLRELAAAYYNGKPPLVLGMRSGRLLIPAYHAVADRRIFSGRRTTSY